MLSNQQCIFQVIDRGIDLMKKNVDYTLLKAWQDYSRAILEIVCRSCDKSIYLDYLSFLITISSLSPYDQLKKSIEKLMEIAQRINEYATEELSD